MMRHQKALVAAAVVMMIGTAPVLGHHALHSEFDTSKRGHITGVLTRFAMVNPHIRWYFDVKSPNGTIAKWEITGAGPQSLRANGMTRIWKVGDTYDVTFAPARDGSNLGRVVTFKFPDGRVITLYHEDPNNPNDR
jgi:hypothetical protein